MITQAKRKQEALRFKNWSDNLGGYCILSAAPAITGLRRQKIHRLVTSGEVDSETFTFESGYSVTYVRIADLVKL